MTRVDFYVLDEPGQRRHDLFICRLTETVWRRGHRVHIHCPDGARAEAIDALLWTFQDTSFVPHAPLDEAGRAEVPVLIGYGDEVPDTTDVLINLQAEVPAYFSQFERVVETTGENAETRRAARIRYRFYQQRGYALTTHTIDPGHD